ncbi:MAG: sigma-70 family RNA polymerase sigma factor [Planctomycetota bacterium]|nr:MAG: sigma-70 family RNA polymerase sigma factor [Planctomycetota bacterium]
MNARDSAPDSVRTLDPESWVDAHGDALFRYALVRVRDRSVAEELVQETFLSALEHRGQYAGRGSERSWLMSILRNKLIDWIRRRVRRRDVEVDAAEWDASWEEQVFDRRGRWREDPRFLSQLPSAEVERQEFWQALMQCMEGLSAMQRSVFALRELEQLPSERICKELAITPSNLWVLMHRARLALARCLSTRFGERPR